MLIRPIYAYRPFYAYQRTSTFYAYQALVGNLAGFLPELVSNLFDGEIVRGRQVLFILWIYIIGLGVSISNRSPSHARFLKEWQITVKNLQSRPLHIDQFQLLPNDTVTCIPTLVLPLRLIMGHEKSRFGLKKSRFLGLNSTYSPVFSRNLRY